MQDVATPAGAGSRRVLLIDDELTIRLALRRFFTRMGWRVDEATNGESGFSMILLDEQQTSTAPYDIILSDLRMPGLNGIELYDRLKALTPRVLARLVFSTGDIVSQEAAEFVNNSSCIVLQKPFELSTLRATIAKVMQAPHDEPSPT